MPTVRTYGTRQVLPSQLPGVRKQAAETEISTGAGLARARGQQGAALGQLGQGVTGLGLELMRQADTTQILELENEVIRKKHQMLYDPTTGALMVQGKDAMELPEKVNQEFTQFVNEVGKRATTPRQKALFEKLKVNTGLDLDLAVRRHVAGEMQQFAASELKANLQNHVNEAIANVNEPEKIGQSLTAALTSLQAGAAGAGMGPAELEAAQKAVKTEVHAGVVQKLLANNKDREAKAYYEATKDDISGDKHAALEKQLNAGATLGEAQRAFDEITSKHDTYKEQLEAAKRIQDPEVRKEVEAMVDHEEVRRDKQQRDADEKSLIDAYNIVDSSKSATELMRRRPDIWRNLDGGQRSALHHYADYLAAGKPVPLDVPTYQALLDQAANDPQTFATQNLLNYKHKLGESEYKQIASLQLNVRQGNASAAAEALSGYRTEKDVIDTSLQMAGIDPNDKTKREPVAFLRQRVAEKARELAQMTGRKPTEADLQAITDSILQQSVTVPGSFMALLRPNTYNYFAQNKRLVDLTIADVPAADQAMIEQSLKAQGWAVNDANILRIYRTRLSSGQK